MATPETIDAITINTLTPGELGICDEALRGGVAQLQDLLKDLSRLPAGLTRPEASLLLTLLGQLPVATQQKVRTLMDQLRAGAITADGGTVIHFPPP